MKRKLIAVILLMLIAPMYSLTAEESIRIARAGRFDAPPVIDGKLDDVCWQGLPPLNNLTLVLYGTGPGGASTEAYVGYDEMKLYVAFDCHEPKIELLKKLLAEGRVLSFEESVEIFVQEDRMNDLYYQFMASLGGKTHEGIRSDASWDAPWEVKAALAGQGYTVEMAIPFKSINAKIAPDSLWGFNVNRSRNLGEKVEYTAWSNTEGGFHAPDKFGCLLFSDYAAFFEAYLETHSKEIAAKMESFFKEYPASTASLKPLKQDFEQHVAAYKAKVHEGVIETEEQAANLLAECKKTLAELEKIAGQVQLEIIRNEFR